MRQSLWLALPLVFQLVACRPVPGQGRAIVLPCQPVVSEAAADRLKERVAPLTQASGPMDFTVQATADEVTSLLVRTLAEYAGESPVENPRVCFGADRIYMAGQFKNVLPFKFDGIVAVEPRLVQGQLSVEVVAASAGSLPVPEALLRSSSKTLSETLTEWLPDVSFREVKVDKGLIVVSGHRGR